MVFKHLELLELLKLLELFAPLRFRAASFHLKCTMYDFHLFTTRRYGKKNPHGLHERVRINESMGLLVNSLVGFPIQDGLLNLIYFVENAEHAFVLIIGSYTFVPDRSSNLYTGACRSIVVFG